MNKTLYFNHRHLEKYMWELKKTLERISQSVTVYRTMNVRGVISFVSEKVENVVAE